MVIPVPKGLVDECALPAPDLLMREASLVDHLRIVLPCFGLQDLTELADVADVADVVAVGS